jgi:hypothetical protein
MRDNHDRLPEIIGALEEGGYYFGLVQLERTEEQRLFRFGVNREGYLALKHILQLRPFDQMTGSQYRYFFVPTVRRLTEESVEMAVRVEQGRDGKQVNADAPRDLVANLMWFFKLDDWSRAQYLRFSSK